MGAPLHCYPSYLAHILWCCVTCGVNMMWLCHGWGWQPPQTDSHIHITHIQSVWAHWYMLSIGIQQQPNTVLRTLIGSDFGVRVYLWSQHDVITSWLMLRFTLNCFPHQYYTYTKCLSTLICCPWAYSSSLKQLYPSYLAQISGFWVTYGVEMMWLCHGWMSWLRLTSTSNCFPHPYYTYTKCSSTLICCPWAYTYSKSLTQLYRSYLGVLGHLWSQHDVIMLWLRLAATSNCFPHPYYTYKVFEHIDMLSMGIHIQ